MSTIIPTVAFLINRFHPITGGTELQALRLAQSLQQRDIKTCVITRRTTLQLPSYEEFQNIHIHRLLPIGIGRLKNYIAAFNISIYLLIKYNSYDIIHAHSVEHITLGAIPIARLLRKPIICKVPTSGDITRESSSNMQLPFYVKVARQLLQIREWRPVLLRWADVIIAVSTEIENELHQLGFKNKTLRIPNGVDIERFHPPSPIDVKQLRREFDLPQEAPIAMFSGRLVRRKGIMALLHAWHHVLNKQPEAILIIAGSGLHQLDSIEEELKSYVSQTDLDYNVRFLGIIDNVEEYLRAANLFVFPSRAEGMPNAMLEAMATALPIVATRIGGTEDLVVEGKQGWLVNVDDVEQISDRIVRVFANREKAKELGQASRERVVQQFSFEVIADQYVELYRKLLDKQAFE